MFTLIRRHWSVSAALRPHAGRGVRALAIAAVLIALLIATPIIGVLGTLLAPQADASANLVATVLPRYVASTALLVLLVGVGSAVIGVSSAWLVTMRRFPGRTIFEWALALPLAFPAYVIAYAYTDLLDHSGAVQTLLRTIMGWGPRDYWFPEIRSLGGAAAMLTLVLYPYVYLLARAAFLQQSVCVIDVSRTLGAGPWRSFFRVALPMARPAIVTGVALVLMETLADFGTVSYFGVQTFATGVYRAWFSMGDRLAAAQLSGWLLMFVLVAIVLERSQRRSQRFQHGRERYHALPTTRLEGWSAAGAFAVCAAPVLLGFVAPLIMLIWMSATGGHAFFGPRYIAFATNSFVLAGVGAMATVALAVVMGYAVRVAPSRLVRLATIIASLGYAIPGGVIAVGLLVPLAAFDNALDAAMRAWFGVSTGLLLTGSIVVLVLAYVVRFMAVAMQTVDAALVKVSPSMDHAARALGETAGGAFRRVHAPLIRGGLLTAGLIVFVDVMKELPATLIMRPFNFDTLAVQAYRLASDERLLEASTPSLAIVLVGLAPLLLLSRQIRKSRPGGVGSPDATRIG